MFVFKEVPMEFPKEVVERYSRLIVLKEFGIGGLKKLRDARVAIVGCGATGSVEAELLARAGVGYLKVIDRDYVDLGNLYRTHLFTEEDFKKSLPKAVACADRLGEINSGVDVEPVVTEINPSNVEMLLKNVDIILDGLDNMETRYLVNEFSVKHGIPWIFVGVERWHGMAMAVIPGETACLKCILPRPPAIAGDACEIRGVINTAVAVTAAIAVNECIKYLLGLRVGGELLAVDCLNMDLEKFTVKRRRECPTCVGRKFEYLGAITRYRAKRICGTPAVMVYPETKEKIDMEIFLRDALREHLDVEQVLPYNARIRIGGNKVIIFADGRAIVEGITDTESAIKLYRKIIEVVGKFSSSS